MGIEESGRSPSFVCVSVRGIVWPCGLWMKSLSPVGGNRRASGRWSSRVILQQGQLMPQRPDICRRSMFISQPLFSVGLTSLVPKITSSCAMTLNGRTRPARRNRPKWKKGSSRNPIGRYKVFTMVTRAVPIARKTTPKGYKIHQTIVVKELAPVASAGLSIAVGDRALGVLLDASFRFHGLGSVCRYRDRVYNDERLPSQGDDLPSNNDNSAEASLRLRVGD